MKNRVSILFCWLALMTGCAEEQKPTSVTEFLKNPIILEAAMVRCAQNRSETRYDATCVNARQAVSIIEAKEERARRDIFETESNRKREALRRTQQVAAEARRRAAESERMRKEAEYLAQFGELPPPPQEERDVDEAAANAPGVIIPEITDEPSDGGNAPAAVSETGSDLEAVREELRNRNEEPGD